jgi:predicted metal-binding protein
MRQIIVCSTCKYSAESKFGPDGQTGGEILLGYLQTAAAPIEVHVGSQACLWNCSRPCSVVLQDSARFSYVTGGHEPSPDQAQAIVDWFKLHGESETGDVSFRAWPDRMRGHFIARLPAWER